MGRSAIHNKPRSEDLQHLQPGPSCFTIAIGVATAGRPQIVEHTILELRRQTRLPDAVIVSSPSLDDVQGLAMRCPEVQIIAGTQRGLPCQRNAILDEVRSYDAIVFFDDDFLPADDYLEAIEVTLKHNAQVVMITGEVLADGIHGPGLSFQAAQQILEQDKVANIGKNAVETIGSAYGCNMAIRLDPVIAQGLRFDEALPLYAWLEDLDFSRQLARAGRIVKSNAARGVHLGVKTGRQAGRRLGYSQIANPLYLIRKRTCPASKGFYLMMRNFAANLVGAVRPEPYIDRRGRLIGNFFALLDLARGCLKPSRALRL